MKKRLLISLILMVSLVLTSCGIFSSEAQKNAITVMGRKSDMEKSYMKIIFDRYREKTGKEIKLIEINDDEFETEAAKRFDSGDVPDVFFHFNNADLARFDVGKNFYYLNDEEWAADLTDSAEAYCLDGDGNLLGLPFWESSVSGCYYNKTLLEELGLRPASTQAEFDFLCQTLSDLGKTPVVWPANGCTWMFQFALDPIFADKPELLADLNANKITYSDIKEVSAMAEWISGAAAKGWFGQDYLKTGWDDISGALSSGDAVMTFIWDTWFYTDYKPGKYTVDDFALMPVFMNTVDGGTYEGGNLNMMMVNKNSEKLELALEFLSFCADPENYNAAFDGISTVSCFKGQTTNIQSAMVTDAAASIAAKERVSTAASKIVGYSADDVSTAFDQLFRGKTDVAGCVKLMDDYRISEAKKQGADGF